MLFDSFEAYDVQETRRVSREEGRIEGKIEGKIESILELLNNIGPLPSNLENTIQSITDLDTLKMLFTLATKVKSIEEFVEKAQL